MERLKEEVRWKTEQAAQLKEFEAASALKRIEVKKKLQEVRKVSARRHCKCLSIPQHLLIIPFFCHIHRAYEHI